MAHYSEKNETVLVNEVEPVDRELIIRLDELRRSDKKWRKRARVILFMYQFMAIALSAFVLGALVYSLDIYLQTRNRLLSNGQPPWPNPAVLWPTYLLLGVSVLTFVSNVLIIFVPCIHRSKKNGGEQDTYSDPAAIKAARKRTGKLLSNSQYLAAAVYFAAWTISSGLFQMANTGKDLWGWSCSTESDAIQSQVQSYLDFGRLCLLQGASWDVMALQAGVWALAVLSYSVAMFRWRRRKSLKALEEQVEDRGV